MDVRINLVVLRSADLERSVEFYTRLGLQFSRHQHGSGPEHYAAELSGTVFELYPETAEQGSTRGTRIGFSVPSLETALAAVQGYPDVVVSPARQSPWGLRAVIADPDGHRVELVQS